MASSTHAEEALALAALDDPAPSAEGVFLDGDMVIDSQGQVETTSVVTAAPTDATSDIACASSLGESCAPPPSKICVGCKCSSMTPSPLCPPGGCRMGDYPDWSSNWDKHCASMARMRYVPMLGSLPEVEAWINRNEENARHFQLRVLAYYSLKLDASVQRPSFQFLEARVEVITTLIHWAKRGCGIPPALGFNTGVMVDLVEASKASENPLMQGGVVGEMKVDGLLRLGVVMPQGETSTLRGGAPRAIPNGCGFFKM